MGLHRAMRWLMLRSEMKIEGAGGTPGGIGKFFIGFLMMCAGFYMLLHSIIVTERFGFATGMYHFAAFGSPVPVTSGMILIPLAIGVGIIFFDARKLVGWALAVGSLVALITGVIANLQFSFRAMSLFDILVILVLCVGGTGMFLHSLTDHSGKEL